MRIVRNKLDWPKHLRLLVNNECNYHCSFPGTGCEWCHKDGVNKTAGNGKRANVEDFLFLAKVLKEKYSLEKIKIGAMEPTLFSGLNELIAGSKELGFKEVSMTSNGYFLEDKLDGLKNAGLDTVTVSMHAFNQEVYRSITGVDGFKRVKEAAEKAIKLGFKKVKVNRVLLNFENVWGDLMSFFNWAAMNGVRIKLYKLIWSPIMDEKQYFENYVSWESLMLYFRKYASVIEINEYLVAGRERLLWRLKNGLEVETDTFSHKLTTEVGKVCQKCKEAPFCLEGLMSYGIEVGPSLSVGPCLLRNDLRLELWDEVRSRDKKGVAQKIGLFLAKTVGEGV